MAHVTDQLNAALADRYVIERELGAGGMATVYLARDAKHNRSVALKVLRPELAAVIGAERFLKEIEVTANLQHPHILPLHDSGTVKTAGGELLYYVMPYVEGESLRALLEREKQLGIDDAVALTRAVAGALDYAHRQGVIHRDIKPENILIHDGQPMIADFGIALAVSHAGGTRLTETGLSIGTPQYMSPEQAMGDRELDARSDVYSLGAMLYEMLAGDPPYTGSTAQAIVAKVITEKATPVTTHRDTVPPHIAAAVAKTLNKLPADRFKSAADFAAALDAASAGLSTHATVAASARRKGPSLWNPLSIATTTAAAILLAITTWLLVRPMTAGPVMRFRVVVDSTRPFFFSGQGNPPRLALSPDGSEIVYVGEVSSSGAARPAMVAGGLVGPTAVSSIRAGNVTGRATVLMHRRLSYLEAQELAGTEGAWAPTFAQDGDRVAFVAPQDGRQALKIVSITGGPPVTVLDSGIGSTPAWGPDDHLYYLDDSTFTVRRVAAGGGPPEVVVRLETPPGTRYAWPTVLPGGSGLILTAIPESSVQTAARAGALTSAGLQVQVFDLATGKRRVSVAAGFGAYAPTGHLLYVTAERTLLAVPFDPQTLEMHGRPGALIEDLDVRQDGVTDLALSANGTLAYTTPSYNAPERVAWVSRNGLAAPVDTAWTRDWEFEGVALSPDAKRAAVVIEDGVRGDVWIKQLDRGPLSRLTFAGAYNAAPTWSPDGRSVLFVSVRDGQSNVWVKNADGSGSDSLLLDLDRNINYAEWSRDGRWLIISVSGPPSDDIFVYQPGVDSASRPVVAEAFDEYEPALSPNGQWLAYVSDESGEEEVYIRPFPNASRGRWQLSTEQGAEPLWSHSGRELYYRSVDGRSIIAVNLANGPASARGSLLARLPSQDDFERNPRNRMIDVAPDGRFLMIQRADDADVSGDLVVVLNWFHELEAKAGK